MTPEALAHALAADLRLDGPDRHLLVSAAARLAGVPDDAQVYVEATALAERHRATSTLAGAFLALSAGIVEERIGSSLDPAARAAREEAMRGIGTLGGVEDSRGADPEVAEALARAADVEAAGDAGTAARIRAAVEAHQRGG